MPLYGSFDRDSIVSGIKSNFISRMDEYSSKAREIKTGRTDDYHYSYGRYGSSSKFGKITYSLTGLQSEDKINLKYIFLHSLIPGLGSIAERIDEQRSYYETMIDLESKQLLTLTRLVDITQRYVYGGLLKVISIFKTEEGLFKSLSKTFNKIIFPALLTTLISKKPGFLFGVGDTKIGKALKDTVGIDIQKHIFNIFSHYSPALTLLGGLKSGNMGAAFKSVLKAKFTSPETGLLESIADFSKQKNLPDTLKKTPLGKYLFPETAGSFKESVSAALVKNYALLDPRMRMIYGMLTGKKSQFFLASLVERFPELNKLIVTLGFFKDIIKAITPEFIKKPIAMIRDGIKTLISNLTSSVASWSKSFIQNFIKSPIQTLRESLKSITSSFLNFIRNPKSLFTGIKNLFTRKKDQTELAEETNEKLAHISGTLEEEKDLLSKVSDDISNLSNTISDKLTNLTNTLSDKLPSIITDLPEKLKTGFNKVVTILENIYEFIKTKLPGYFSELIQTTKEISINTYNFVKDKTPEYFTNLVDYVKQIASSVKNLDFLGSLKDTINNIKEKLSAEDFAKLIAGELVTRLVPFIGDDIADKLFGYKETKEKIKNITKESSVNLLGNNKEQVKNTIESKRSNNIKAQQNTEENIKENITIPNPLNLDNIKQKTKLSTLSNLDENTKIEETLISINKKIDKVEKNTRKIVEKEEQLVQGSEENKKFSFKSLRLFTDIAKSLRIMAIMSFFKSITGGIGGLFSNLLSFLPWIKGGKIGGGVLSKVGGLLGLLKGKKGLLIGLASLLGYGAINQSFASQSTSSEISSQNYQEEGGGVLSSLAKGLMFGTLGLAGLSFVSPKARNFLKSNIQKVVKPNRLINSNVTNLGTKVKGIGITGLRTSGSVLKFIGRKLPYIAAGLVAHDLYKSVTVDDKEFEKRQKEDKTLLGRLDSASSYAMVGGLISSAIPGVGTVVGTMVGGLIGLLAPEVKTGLRYIKKGFDAYVNFQVKTTKLVYESFKETASGIYDLGKKTFDKFVTTVKNNIPSIDSIKQGANNLINTAKGVYHNVKNEYLFRIDEAKTKIKQFFSKPEQIKNANILEESLKKANYTEAERAAIISYAYKESGLLPQVESMRYSVQRLKQVFPRARSVPDEALQLVVNSGEVGIAEALYGPKNSPYNPLYKYPQYRNYIDKLTIGPQLGNTEPGDGFRFRGRGYIQITGRAMYQAISERLYEKGVLKDKDALVKNPDLVNDPTVGAEATIAFLEIKKFKGGKYNDFNSAIYAANDVIAGKGHRIRQDEYGKIVEGNAFRDKFVVKTNHNPIANISSQIKQSQQKAENTAVTASTTPPPQSKQQPLQIQQPTNTTVKVVNESKPTKEVQTQPKVANKVDVSSPRVNNTKVIYNTVYYTPRNDIRT